MKYFDDYIRFRIDGKLKKKLKKYVKKHKIDMSIFLRDLVESSLRRLSK